ncbi:MAG: TonB-dependent hemoglobin/transferrin/lactoferrin family receptor [Proteobacteria bacterium]|nr:TonB-dependent hemoglobin/transferrin/lactoferrin family receptor [Pseudomonadota bacterium]
MTTRTFLLHLLTTTALGAICSAASAQTIPAPSEPTQLDAVTTAATRTHRPIDEVPGTVSVITTQDIDRDNMQTMSDLVHGEPGVSVGNQPNRAGFTNFIIRGIGGNRVLVLSDGIRVPDFPGSNVGAGNYTRDFVELESVKQVEIVRGPASALYGSDALGGVVAYTTKDPSDYLITGGRDYFVSLKSAYSGAGSDFAETATGAVRSGNVEFMGIYTRRDGRQTDPAFSSLPTNPQSTGENNFFAKFVYRPTEHDTVRVVGEYYDAIQNTQVLSDVGVFPSLYATIYDEWASDLTQRYRLSTQWVHDAPIGFIDRVDLLTYFSAVNRQEDTMQLRGATSGVVPSNYRTSSFWFVQSIYGAELQLNTNNARLFGLKNDLTYGLSFSYTATSRPRNRVQVTMASGIATTTVGGETFPNKNFPDTGTIQGGVYLQDEITAGRLSITPAVRLDYYNLQPNPDADFWRSSGAVSLLPQATTYWSASPKLGLLYHLTDQYSGYFQYARGFRAPPYDNANFAYTNAASLYQILPNTNLKPETSDGFEVGLRGKYRDGSSWQLAAFYNLYNNFIDTTVVGTVGALTQYQYVNLSNVNIWGIEARGEYRFMPEWSLLGWIAYAYGYDTATGLPVDSVNPFMTQARLRYGYESTGLGAQLIATFAGAHNQVSSPTYFQAPAYFTLDATVGYTFSTSVKANVGAFNITNAQYWNSQDVIGVAANSNQLGRYAQPGRYFGANLILKW